MRFALAITVAGVGVRVSDLTIEATSVGGVSDPGALKTTSSATSFVAENNILSCGTAVVARSVHLDAGTLINNTIKQCPNGWNVYGTVNLQNNDIQDTNSPGLGATGILYRNTIASNFQPGAGSNLKIYENRFTNGTSLVTYGNVNIYKNNIFEGEVYIDAGSPEFNGDVFQGNINIRSSSTTPVFYNVSVKGSITASSVTPTIALVNSTIKGTVASSVIIDNGTPTLKAYTARTLILDNSSSTALSITQSGAGYAATFMGGNVGIGTTSPVQKLHVEGQCVTGDTLLKRKRRRRKSDGTWEEFWEDVRIDEIKAGDEIQTVNEATGQLVVSRVNALMDMGRKEIYTITTVTGKTIRTTGNHPYLVAPKIHAPRLAIFVDAANLEMSAKLLHLSFDYKDIMRAFPEGELRYYSVDFATSGQRRFMGYLSSLGAKIITKPLKVITQRHGDDKHKANFDVEIACDAILEKDNYDTLILFSGDSDFTYTTNKLKDLGKKVVVISPWRTTGRELRNAANLYLDLYRMPFVSRSNEAGNEKRPRGASQSRFINGKGILTQIYPFVNGGCWTKVKELTEGQMIATAGVNDKAVYEQIVEIKQTYTEQVYDIEVEGTHNFIANGILAHNTYLTGNVGIGTTSPSTKLHVVGDGTYAASFISGNVGIGTVTPGARLDVSGGDIRLAQGGCISWPDHISVYRCSITVNQSPNYNLQIDSPKHMTFRVNDGNTTAMSIDNSGNVGIGTTGPSYKLQVIGNGGFSTGVESTSFYNYGNPGNGMSFPNINYLNFNAGVASLSFNGDTGVITSTGSIRLADTKQLQWGGTTNFITGSNASNYLAFNTNNTERVRIDSAGNVGIGTTGPGALLDVAAGDIRISTTNNFSSVRNLQVLRLQTKDSAGTSFTAGSVKGYQYGSATGGLLFNYYNASEQQGIELNSSGYVGIGISPDVQFQIKPGTLRIGSTGGGKCWVKTTSGTRRWFICGYSVYYEL